MTPQALAEACARALWAEDQRLESASACACGAIAPGEAELAMAIDRRMVNGHGICHGGFIFTLADSAFAFACNSYNRRSVGAAARITYLRPASLGEVLTARGDASVRRAGRSGIYDVHGERRATAQSSPSSAASRAAIEGHLVATTP